MAFVFPDFLSVGAINIRNKMKFMHSKGIDLRLIAFVEKIALMRAGKYKSKYKAKRWKNKWLETDDTKSAIWKILQG